MPKNLISLVLITVICCGLMTGCSKEPEQQFDPPEMVLPGSEDYAKGLEFLKKQDIAGAIPWFERAIEQGNPEANYHMGLLHARGDNVPQDYMLAHEHFHKAAMMGHPKALYYLGHLYGEGSGVEQDYVEALKWFWLSASYGDKRAKKFIRVMINKVTTEEYQRAEKEVKKLWEQLPHDVFLRKEEMVLH